MWTTALASEMVVVSGGGASSVISYCGVASRELSEEESSVSGEAEYSSSVYSSEALIPCAFLPVHVWNTLPVY